MDPADFDIEQRELARVAPDDGLEHEPSVCRVCELDHNPHCWLRCRCGREYGSYAAARGCDCD